MTTTAAGPRAGSLTPMHKVGLGMATLLSLADLVGPFAPAPDGEVGPPAGVLWLGFAFGALTLAGVVWAFRAGAPAARRLVAGSRVLSVLLALPAFFVDVPTAIKVLVAVAVALTAATVVLVLAPQADRGDRP